MSFKDFCQKFSSLSRTRLFNHEWTIVQQWTSVHVSWVSGYLTTKFVIDVKKAGTVVVVLSQVCFLDNNFGSTLITNNSIYSSTAVTSEDSKDSIYSTSTFSSKRKAPRLANTSSEPAACRPTGQTDLSLQR
jgi:hypothetical protein